MDMRTAFQTLQDSAVFKQFHEEQAASYLAHAFIMLEGEAYGPWLFGYYSKDRDKITVFEVEKEVKKAPEDDVFKRHKVVLKLSLEGAMDFGDARSKALEVKEKDYPNKVIAKTMAILQTIYEGTVWNITFITNDFYLINIKLGAKDGEVKHQSIDSILSLKKEG